MRGADIANPVKSWSAAPLLVGVLAAGVLADVVQAQTYTITPVQFSQSACVGDDVDINWRLFTVDGYNFPVSLSFPSLPSNIFALAIFPSSLTPTPQGPNVLTQLIVGPGTLGPTTITLRGIGGNGLTRTATSTIVRDAVPGAPKPVTPEYGASTSTTPTFEWTGSIQAKSFRFQVALNDSFTPNEIIFERLIIDQPNPNALTVDTPLPANTTLYWRVQGENHCGSGFFSPVFPFFTGGMCAPLTLDIPDGGTVSHPIQVSRDGQLADVDLLLHSDHPRIGDLDIRLTHDSTSVQLMAPGNCAQPGVAAHFDDRATAAVASACGVEGPAVAGGVRPQETLSAFNGQPMQGQWHLQVTDTLANGQSGRLLGGCLQPKAAAVSDVLFANGMEAVAP